MYPSGELNLLAQRKAAVRRRIAAGREQCIASAAEFAQPLALVDRGIALWRSVPPLAKAIVIPGLLFLARKLGRRGGFFGAIARLAPTVLGVARSVASR